MAAICSLYIKLDSKEGKLDEWQGQQSFEHWESSGCWYTKKDGESWKVGAEREDLEIISSHLHPRWDGEMRSFLLKRLQ